MENRDKDSPIFNMISLLGIQFGGAGSSNSRRSTPSRCSPDEIPIRGSRAR